MENKLTTAEDSPLFVDSNQPTLENLKPSLVGLSPTRIRNMPLLRSLKIIDANGEVGSEGDAQVVLDIRWYQSHGSKTVHCLLWAVTDRLYGDGYYSVRTDNGCIDGILISCKYALVQAGIASPTITFTEYKDVKKYAMKLGFLLCSAPMLVDSFA